MPQVSKEEINLIEKRNDLFDKFNKLLSKKTKLTKEEKAEMQSLNKEINATTKSIKAFDKEAEEAVDTLVELQKKTKKLGGQFKEVGSDKKFGKFLDEIADQSKKAGPLIAKVSDNLAQLKSQGKGSGDLAKGLAGVVKTETDILTIASDRSKLADADIKSMRASAKQSLARLKTAGAQTKTEQEHVKLQLQQITSLERMQLREEAINDAKEKGNELAGKAHDIYMRLTSGPLVLFVTILEGIKKLVGAVSEITKDVQKSIGGSAARSAELAASLKASQGFTRGAAIAATGLGANVREAQIEAGLAADNMEVMKNASIGVNEAVVALQSGLQASQVAELAQTMSEVTDLSREAASAQLNSVMAFAEMNNVAPAAVMSDMAENAAQLAIMTDGSADSMARLAVLARKAGIELSAMNSIADGLLNIEESLNAEFEASVLLNRDINLDLARQAALQNDMEGMVSAIQDELGGMDFGSLDRLQRESLASAVGVGADDLGRIMSRSGEELQGSVEEQALKTTKDLAKEAVIHTDKFGTMITFLMTIAGLLAMNGPLGKMLGKGFKKLGGTKAGKAAMGALKSGKAAIATGATAVASKTGSILKGAKDTVMNVVKGGGTKGVEKGLQKEAAEQVTKKTAGGIGKWLATKVGGQALKKIPVLGALPAIAFAGMRAMKGDFVGAGLEIASGAANLGNLLAPGAGSAASFGIDAAIMARDMGAFGGGMAKGGPVSKSGTYMVGEKGPELVALSKGSHVIPNNMLGGLAGGATNGDLMAQTNEKLDTLISLMSKVDINTNSTATGVNNINIRTGR